MTAMAANASSPLTVHDLEGMPDDGRRYELVDGVLVVTPAPGWPHQEMAFRLAMRLDAACPPDLRVIVAPFAVRPSLHLELQPDVLVARYEDLTLKDLPVAPVLAVEVFSRTTRLVDLNLKKAAFARLGVRSYWLLEPDPIEPSITALELSHEGDYHTVAAATGGEKFEVSQPFPIQLCPADLLTRLYPA